MPMKRAFLVSALLAAAAQAQTVTWDKWDPMAVRTNRTVDVMLTLQTAGTVNGVRLDYADAGTMNQLDANDMAEALAAATAIGDDRLQKQSQGRVVPESFTHGTSEQRVRWFKRGMDSGNPGDCDTFSASVL